MKLQELEYQELFEISGGCFGCEIVRFLKELINDILN
jgi:hypothetical protein